ncbi:1-phosphofructokinase [Oceanobacillus massiliensis]|uniref:1-phosphofructokinase n=1 Tax=Oceanobacillus massiliensis TaxID=1465765 RepID=UPI000288A759|nr:1-phosphofructokinase [Oceanobacillus massiliensis]
MIYTITLNPSIDYIVPVNNFKTDALNYMENDFKLPGGKGINVSRILHELEMETTALGFIGGFTGDFIANWLENDHVMTDFIQINGDTRINIKLKSGTETEINGRGPSITKEEADQLLHQMDRTGSKDTVILSGSKPPSLPDNYYQSIIESISQSRAEFVIDTTGEALMAALPYKPLLVKPNSHELAQLFEVNLNTQQDILHYGSKLLDAGAKHVIISLAADGALLITNDGAYIGKSPKGTVKNSVGAGDSMIAGFIADYLQKQDPISAFKMGIASGSATAFSDDLAKKDDILSLLSEVHVTRI